jgi:aspartate 1-decarboxylase
MQRTLLKSKIHRATVTACDLNYVGSLTIDAELMAMADIRAFEAVHVVNVNNGARFQTYAMTGDVGSGQMQVNGAAARLAHHGDIVIVFSYAIYTEAEMATFMPLVIVVDRHNRPVAAADAHDASTTGAAQRLA